MRGPFQVAVLLAPALARAVLLPPLDAIPAAFIAVELPEADDDVNGRDLTFRFDVLESAAACGYANVTINGQPLPEGGHGALPTDQEGVLVASWDFTCIGWDGEAREQLMRVAVESVDGAPVEDVHFALRFQQVAPVRVSAVEGAAVMARLPSESRPAVPITEEMPYAELEDELAHLEFLREQLADLEHIIYMKEKYLVESFGWGREDTEQCRTLKCVVKTLFRKVASAAKELCREAVGLETPHHPHWPHWGHWNHTHGNHTHGNHTFPHPPWRRPHHPPPFCHCPPHHAPPDHPPHDGPPPSEEGPTLPELPESPKAPEPPVSPEAPTQPEAPAAPEQPPYSAPASDGNVHVLGGDPSIGAGTITHILPGGTIKTLPNGGTVETPGGGTIQTVGGGTVTTSDGRSYYYPGYPTYHHRHRLPVLKFMVLGMLLAVSIALSLVFLHRRCRRARGGQTRAERRAARQAKRESWRQRWAMRRAARRAMFKASVLRIFSFWSSDKEKTAALPRQAPPPSLVLPIALSPAPTAAPAPAAPPSDDELETTMEQEIAQLRAAADVVGDIIAAEEGRGRAMQQRQGVQARPVVFSGRQPSPGGAFSDYMPDDESLPPYDESENSVSGTVELSVVANGLRYTPDSSEYTPTSSQYTPSTGSSDGSSVMGANDAPRDTKN